MVPMDQPAAALDMITRFMLDKNLAETDDIYTEQQKALTRRQQQQQRGPRTAAAAEVTVV